MAKIWKKMKRCLKQYNLIKDMKYLINNKILMEALPELAFKNLGCYCSPLSCHGDILKKYVDKIDLNIRKRQKN